MTDAEILEIIADGIVDGTDMDCTPADQARAVLKALRDAGVLQEWQPIETAPNHVLHVRGVWVNSAATGNRLYFEANAGYIDEGGYFITSSGDECGWMPEDFTHWMPLPEAPQ
jgi:hypothetical protein